MDRFECAISAIDHANSADPNTLGVGGVARPKEVVHAEMLTDWVTRLSSGEPSEALLLAARAHHIRRWEVPRSSYPEGRGGYLRWRSGMHDFHAQKAAEILRECGYDEATIGRVSGLIRKRNLGRDAEVQVLEDGLCLVFIETQFDELAGRTAGPTLQGIIEKTWRKMSPAGQAAALDLVTPEQRAIVESALRSGGRSRVAPG